VDDNLEIAHCVSARKVTHRIARQKQDHFGFSSRIPQVPQCALLIG
jgi:hypothetical protein